MKPHTIFFPPHLREQPDFLAFQGALLVLGHTVTWLEDVADATTKIAFSLERAGSDIVRPLIVSDKVDDLNAAQQFGLACLGLALAAEAMPPFFSAGHPVSLGLEALKAQVQRLG
jgi:hypothetical protein